MPKDAVPRLLIVEDDRDLNELIAGVAREHGCEVRSAYTGEDALALLRTEQIDWLLADIRLPGRIDGWNVGSEFSLSHPLRPIIYISGTERDSSRKVAGSIFLFKPVELSDLVAMFERLGIRANKARGLGDGKTPAQLPA
jgi:two-component system OmpR family response regulator